MDDVEAVELQVGESDVDRSGDSGRVAVLEFEAEPPAATHDEKVELGAAVGRPEEAFSGPRTQAGDHLRQAKAFPGGSNLGVARQVGKGLQVEECVQEPAVDDVDLGGFDLALLEILVP